MGNDMFNDEQLAHLKDRADEIEALRLALETATTRAQSLSNELLDAMHARDNHRDRAATMSLMLDTIEGVATGQPGEIPTAVEDGWSTALGAVVALVRERDHNANVVLEQNKLWSDRCESAERERDEARAVNDVREREVAEIMASDLPYARAIRESHENFRLFQEQRELARKATSELDAALSRARETDGAVREAALHAIATLRGGASHLLAMSTGAHHCPGCGLIHAEWISAAVKLESALSSPPRPETKGDDKGGAA